MSTHGKTILIQGTKYRWESLIGLESAHLSETNKNKKGYPPHDTRVDEREAEISHQGDGAIETLEERDDSKDDQPDQRSACLNRRKVLNTLAYRLIIAKVFMFNHNFLHFQTFPRQLLMYFKRILCDKVVHK